MTDCRLTINSQGNGWKNDVVCPARLEVGEGTARIVYQLEGDDCSFSFSNGRAEQVRKGGVNVRISFVQGSKTVCVLGDENLRGGYGVFTQKLSCVVKPHGVTAVIEYLSGDDREKITVKLRAIALHI